MKKSIFVFCVCCAAMAMTICSCSNSDDNEGGNEKVALILPDGATVSRWADDAKYLTNSLKSYNYEVQLFTAPENEQGAAQQVQQIENAIKAGFKNIVITAIDYEAINKSGLLEANQDCNFICYDRMIMDNDAVDFYTTCDPSKIGEMQAQFLLEKIGIDKLKIEYFAGPKTDKNAVTYFNSAYNLLKNSSEMLDVPSGKTSFESVSLKSWSSEDARIEMANRLEATKTVPDLILAPNDNVADGIIKAIEDSKLTFLTYPVITGQDLTDAAKSNIQSGKQAMSIYKENADLAETTAMIVNGFISGKPVKTSQTFNNGKKEVPVKYTNFTLVTINNIGKYITNR